MDMKFHSKPVALVLLEIQASRQYTIRSLKHER